MSRQYDEMDQYSDEEIALFKSAARDTEIDISLLSRTGVTQQIVAEGDSWFDFLPGTDLIDCLRRHHKLRIKNYAKAGDTLENMIYGTDIKRNFQLHHPQFEEVLNDIRRLQPGIFLFSGGGNDVAGDSFESYLNHAISHPAEPVRKEFLTFMISDVFKPALSNMILKVAAASARTHIVMHGYGHTIPDGRGVSLVGFRFAGPWLRPALSRKRIFDQTIMRRTVEIVIDEYNEMLADLDNQHGNFHFVDLRPTILPDQDWRDELHLTNSAFARSAAQIANKINQILNI